MKEVEAAVLNLQCAIAALRQLMRDEEEDAL